MRLFEPVEGFGGAGVGRLVGVDEEGFGAVAFLDVGFGDTGLQVQDPVGVVAEDAEDAWEGLERRSCVMWFGR